MCVCVCVCVCERERERQTDKQTDRRRHSSWGNRVPKPCGRRPMEQLRNGKKASVAGAWRVRGGWRFGQWLDCKRGLTGHGKDLGF